MREIQLTQGKVAIVADADFEMLSQWKWFCNSGGYAARTLTRRPHKWQIRMHRVILGITDPSIDCDHRNGDKLDNRRENLRACTRAENMRNKAKMAIACASPFKGVCWHKATNRWIASIKRNGESFHLGLFRVEEEAARAYDAAAKELFGEFARLNCA
jgi:hypothetical protein